MTTILSTERSRSEPAKGASAFEDVLKNVRVLTKSDGSGDYQQAKPGATAPEYFNYQDIEKPGTVAADTVRYTDKDGNKVIVYKSSSPELYKQVSQDFFAREAQKDGYTLSVDNTDTLSYYDKVTEIDTSHADQGVITYKFGANEWVVKQSSTPDTFARLEKLDDLMSHKGDGYAIAGPDQQLPIATTDYKSITRQGDDKILVETASGEKYVVSKTFNPTLFSQADGVLKAKEVVDAGKAEGYEVQTTLPSNFDYSKLQVDSIDKDTGVIFFQYDGKKYLLPPSDAKASDQGYETMSHIRVGLAGAGRTLSTPADPALSGSQLYQLLNAADEVKGTMSADVLKNAYSLPNQHAVRDSDDPLKLDQIQSVQPFSDGVLQVNTKDGKTLMVVEQLAPEAFAAYGEKGKSLDGIAKAQSDGYTLAGPTDYLPNTDDISAMGQPGEYGPGLISFTYQKPGGETQKIIVSEDLNPEMYQQVADHQADISAQINDVDKLRADHGLPPESEVSLRGLTTTEKDEDGKPLSVQDLTMKELLDEYRAGVKDGSIAQDDPRAKFVRAIEAKSLSENGMSIVPEHGQWYQGDADDPISVTSRDVDEKILDERAIDEQLNTLMGDPNIQKDMKAKYDDALTKVDGGSDKVEQTKQKLLDSSSSDQYIEYINSLQEGGHPELAQQDLQQTYADLHDIDPAKADQFLQSMQSAAYTIEINKMVGDPSKVSDDNSALATQDVVSQILKGAKNGSIDIPRNSLNSYEKFVQELLGDKTKAKDFGTALTALGDTWQKNGKITLDDINKTVSTYPGLSDETRSSFVRNLSVMNDLGILGSAGGTVALVKAVYQVAGGKIGDTPQARLAAASDFISFLSVDGHFAKLGTNIVDKVFGTKSNEMLGLSKSVPDMWKTPGTLPDASGIPQTKESVQSAFYDSIDNAILDGKDPGKALNSGAFSDENIGKIQKGIQDGIESRGKSVVPSTAFKIAGSVIKVIGAASDVAGGLIGVVLGGFSIKDGIKDGDPIKIATGSLGIAGGLGGIIGGITSVAGALGIGGRVIAGMGPVGFVLSGVLGFVSVILGTIKTNKLHKISLQNWDQIKQFEKDGLLAPNGAEAYVWLQTYLSNYGQRDAPSDQSIFDYRASEWDSRQTQPDGTHKDYDGDGPNLFTQKDRQPFQGK